MLRKAGKGYVLGVAANHVFRSWGKKQLIGGSAAKIAQSLPKSAWRRLSSGEGTKGPRLHDWAYLELADLDVAQYNSTLTGEWTRGLLSAATLPMVLWHSSPPGAPRACPRKS
jgi:SRSO17 transposase